MAEGFLGRWSRRKLDAKEGRAAEEPVREQPSPQPSPASGRGSDPASGRLGEAGAAAVAHSSLGREGRGEETTAPDRQQPPEPPPTLDDVADLTPASDFRRFVARGVTPEVRNAALKKLFADPHFNAMDGLDVYIDDYTRPDPIPAAMLRQLASAKVLGLLRDGDGDGDGDTGPAPGPSPAGSQSVAQSDGPGDGPPTAQSDANPDLRLQQDDAAEGGEPGHGTG